MPAIKTKLLLSIIAVLFVALLISLYLNFNKPVPEIISLPTPTIYPTVSPPPTADWKTYTNTAYGFSFKYPSAWFTENVQGSDSIYFSTTSYRYPGILILDIKPNNGQKIEDYIKRDPPSLEVIKKINQNNLNGIIVSDPATMGGSVYIAYLSDNNIISLRLSSNPPDLGDHPLLILDQILSTFKFIDQTSKLTPTPLSVKTLQYKLPTGWKTVRDTSGILELGYDPSEYETASIAYKSIYLKYISNGFYGGNVRVVDYDGGSRHLFLLKASGAGDSFDKTDTYYEKNFQYNHKSCLLISGAYVSASLDTWMMCDIGGGKAVFINAHSETRVTSLMSSVKTF